jgi:transglutaminase-like putative cysteine protease
MRISVASMSEPDQKIHPNFSRYLKSSTVIDFNNPDVARKARELANGLANDREIAQSCFLYVRDEIFHSWDHRKNPVTLSASEVLRHGTGYCYAKSHLLAALLRANNIPAGLCYQRLVCNEFGQPFFIHGLNAVWLEGSGWYRADARGLKPGYPAAFTPPVEALPYATRLPGESDLPEIWDEPIPAIVHTLTKYTDFEAVRRNLPDIEVVNRR